MKNFIKFVWQQLKGIRLALLAISISTISGVYAQQKQSITGKLSDQNSRQAVPYAVVSLSKAADQSMINGAISDTNGVFEIVNVSEGTYTLLVSTIGYKPVVRNIVIDSKNYDAGTINLEATVVNLSGTVVVAEQLKAKSERAKTTFFMTQKMLAVSNTGMDALKLIPGIQVDLMQNISLEGSRNILIFVDGIERDNSFLNQLNSNQIEKIEVISVPLSNYDANVTGAINIILKKTADYGFSGQIYLPIPTSRSEIYMFPTCSFDLKFKKLNIYTSYNGEISYFDLHEKTYRKVLNSSGVDEITSNQYVRQKNWSHKFHFGIDYILDPRDQFNIYANINPYSREYDGYADAQISGSMNKYWQAKKEDQDINTGMYYSLYYKHIFRKAGNEITFDISNYQLKAENTTAYLNDEQQNNNSIRINTSKPTQNTNSIKIDYTSLGTKKLGFSTGIKAKLQDMQDMNSTDFKYNESILAAYASMVYKHTKYDLSVGLRAEKSISTLKNSFRNTILPVLPNTTFRYRLTAKQNIQVSYNRSVNRPALYQLNPFTSIDDPFTVRKGNPMLKPETCSKLFIEHSIQFGSNYFSSRLFYSRTNNAINNLTNYNDSYVFETQVQNLGTIDQYGVQLLGSYTLGRITFNPYLRVFELQTTANDLAKQNGVGNRHRPGFDSGLTTMMSFNHDIAVSLVFQYASPLYNIQDSYFCDALYFISLEKTFKQKIKVGVVSALPFTKSFTYQGSEIDQPGFYSRYEGNLTIATPFAWFKVSYQFNSGKSREKINRTYEDMENAPKKGF
jgi:hypothetical protein